MTDTFKLTTELINGKKLVVKTPEGKVVSDKRPWEIKSNDDIVIVIKDDRKNRVQAWVIETPDSFCKDVELWQRSKNCSARFFSKAARKSGDKICFTVIGWNKQTKTKYINDPIIIVRPKVKVM